MDYCELWESKAVVAYFSLLCLDGQRKSTEILNVMRDNLDEIQTTYFCIQGQSITATWNFPLCQ